MNQFKVFHANHPNFGFGGKDPIFNDQNYTHVATVECENLEHVFQVTNHIDHDWTTNKEVVWKKGTGANTRSTSCGDVVQDMTTCSHYRCMFNHWKKIT